MDLHRVGQSKEAFITDHRHIIHWDIAFIRDVHNWNLGFLSPFLILYLHILYKELKMRRRRQDLLGSNEAGNMHSLGIKYLEG